ncbi:hypothetical protein THASP1DRAFT_25162 [Thamnocephalis sphaerospora]|uniref:Uncharacterized protein n=1 Tax=Thamnocephalis sphaerospora TaxID=78915 RepID=A0A4P9XL29_9FUNG|nr:hypothetical protein THASP1DRAFT_25162 [Thamnocephalis sphaerospora]|eukprot:RKP06538.1 hypothetical protein THASP1DRAFT_25162 [Thamnocephalis sphaerospora]
MQRRDAAGLPEVDNRYVDERCTYGGYGDLGQQAASKDDSTVWLVDFSEDAPKVDDDAEKGAIPRTRQQESEVPCRPEKAVGCAIVATRASTRQGDTRATFAGKKAKQDRSCSQRKRRNSEQDQEKRKRKMRLGKEWKGKRIER